MCTGLATIHQTLRWAKQTQHIVQVMHLMGSQVSTAAAALLNIGFCYSAI